MATVVPENWACIVGNDEFGGIDFSKIDCALLMSLLDDTQGVGEDCDDDRLRSVIQSLEAEIDGHMTDDGNDSFKDSGSSSDSGQFKSQHFSESDGLDLKWMEMEVDIESSFSMPNEGVNSCFMDPNCENHCKMDGLVEYYCNGVEFDESDDCGSLWQETNASTLKQG